MYKSINITNIEEIIPGHISGNLIPTLIKMGELSITPFDESSLGNICYYLHLNNKFRKFKKGEHIIRLSDSNSIEDAFEVYETHTTITIYPGESIIGQTYESLYISERLLGKLENTSALGRIFINHASHGFTHPGHGKDKPVQIMVELTNLGIHPIELEAAEVVDGKVKGTHIMRLYIEKLPYQATPYIQTSNVEKLRMDSSDNS